jgi:adenylyltransferase/sulfurtransferase
MRQIPLIGEEGQKKLSEATVVIAGAGGLGSPAAFYLAAAGTGTLVIADSDTVEESNLNRQILHAADSIGMPKVLSAGKTLKACNPDVKVLTRKMRIDDDTAASLIAGADIVVDAVDNFEARYALNRAAVAARIPLMHAAVSGFSGQATLIIPGETPCLSCIFPDVQKTRAPPVLGTAPGILGTIEAQEVIKYLTGTGETLAGKLLLYDGLKNRMDLFSVKQSPRCRVCGGI